MSHYYKNNSHPTRKASLMRLDFIIDVVLFNSDGFAA